MNPVIQALQPPEASTTSLDLPPALAALLSMDGSGAAAPMAAPMGMPAAPEMQQAPMGLGAAMSSGGLPAYEEGGMIGPGGMPASPMGEAGMPAMGGLAQAPTPVPPAEREQLISQGMAQNPQIAQEIQAALMQGIQSGEITTQELNMIVQLVQVAAQNPDMYPYVRKFAIQQGIATEEDLPEEYNEGVMIALSTVAKSAQQMMQGGQNMMAGGQMQSLEEGGPVNGKADGPVPIMAHEGEYVIPKIVVQMKGREFFDKLVEQYKDKSGESDKDNS